MLNISAIIITIILTIVMYTFLKEDKVTVDAADMATMTTSKIEYETTTEKPTVKVKKMKVNDSWR